MLRILLIDDDRLMTKMYKGKFEDDGFQIETAADGSSGLVKASGFMPDLILLDIMMPKMDGLTILEKFKKNPALKDIPVILLTNVGDDEDYVKQGLEAGAVAYLVKSQHNPRKVVAKVKDVLVKHGVKNITPQELMKARVRGDRKTKVEREKEEAEKEYEVAQKLAAKASDKLRKLKGK